ncbi:MAG: hypothetical protein KatS3mg082_1736 [Nitrospiraceae bacterium]|nr:MAG: hypothetical protein KatS3mg082_1736 [Nitrospiraceae bacterium]
MNRPVWPIGWVPEASEKAPGFQPSSTHRIGRAVSPAWARALHDPEAGHATQWRCLMEEAVEEKTLAPVPAGIPLKLVILISLGALLIGLGGAFALLKWERPPCR